MRCLALLACAAALAACEPAADHTGNDLVYAPVGNAPAGPAPVQNEPATNTPATNEPTPETPAPTTPAGDYRSALKLTGTEPFWGVQIGDKITLQRPDYPDMTVANTGPTINGDVAVWNARDLIIRLEPGECSDGMSNNRYPYKATVTVKGEVLRGCAARADQWPRGEG